MQPALETTNETVDALPATRSGWPPPPTAPVGSDELFWSVSAGQAADADWHQFLDMEDPVPDIPDPDAPDSDATNRDGADPGFAASIKPRTAPGSMGAASIFDLLPVPNDDLLPNW